MSEPDLAKQSTEEGAASVPTEAPAAVGVPSPEDSVAVSPIPADAVPRPEKESATYLRDTRGLLFSLVASAVLLPALFVIYTSTPAAVDAPSLAAAVTIAPVAPLPAPDGSGSGSSEAAGQPAAYEPVAFAWVIELEDGPYLLTSLGYTGSGYPTPPRGTNGDEPATYGRAFQSYRGTSPNPAFDALLKKRFVLFNGETQCEAVAEDVGQLAWFTDHSDIGGDFERYIRADDGSIPWQPGLGLPALSKDGPGLSETIYALAEKDPAFMARVTMQAAYTFAAHGDNPLDSAVKLRVVSKDAACSHVSYGGFSSGWIGRSAELPPIVVSAPVVTTKKALGLDNPRLWPSSKEIDKTCGWRGRKPLQREFDFNAQPDALTWTAGDGTEYAWANYRKVWEGKEWEGLPSDGDSSCIFGLIIEIYWKRKSGTSRWTRDVIFETPDSYYTSPEGSKPPFLIVDLKDGKAPSGICGRSYNTSYRCSADSNPLVYGPPHELELNVTN